ncbi:MAG: GxxExxY protein [Leptospiraceae bacterium]|nr:GxxExxY protein [Leptospiraceae bacterium]
MDENDLSKLVFDLGLKIHKFLGPGLLESAYEECLYYEIVKQGIEVKAVESLNSLHMAQLLTYLKLSDCKLGLLINFNTTLFKKGVKRVINGSLE